MHHKRNVDTFLRTNLHSNTRLQSSSLLIEFLIELIWNRRSAATLETRCLRDYLIRMSSTGCSYWQTLSKPFMPIVDQWSSIIPMVFHQRCWRNKNNCFTIGLQLFFGQNNKKGKVVHKLSMERRMLTCVQLLSVDCSSSKHSLHWSVNLTTLSGRMLPSDSVIT